MTDLEIEKEMGIKDIKKIIKKYDIKKSDYELYGDYMAKIKPDNRKSNSKLILVTSLNPTKFGEGKTTVSIALSDALNSLKKKACVVLREPSLGPVFGIKGGATGGGYSQIVPMEEINLHFTGDFHAITSANNLISSIIDNSLYFGNPLKINPETINFHRCLDLNDRALRNVSLNIEGKITRKEKFNITASSEMMSIMTLSKDLDDLKRRIDNILVGFSYDNEPIYFKSFKSTDAVAILLKKAMYPNLVQTLRGNLALIHLGPFANISHGCNSILATKTALNIADYVVTEAGFGADLGAEKFLDLVSRTGDFVPSCAVLVLTLRAVKLNGGMDAENIYSTNFDAIKNGIELVKKHYDNLKNIYNLNVVVCLNKFIKDSVDEVKYLISELKKLGINVVECSPYEKDIKKTVDLAKAVLDACDNKNFLNYAYNLNDKIEKKLDKIIKNVYGAKKIILTEKAKEKLEQIKNIKLNKLPIIVAKTQYSLSDDPKKIGVTKDFDFTISDFEIYSGAGYIVAVAGNMLLMPGLSKTPNILNMKIDNNGNISGLS